jgi:hypothetical protein
MSLSLQNKPMMHQRFAPSARFAGASVAQAGESFKDKLARGMVIRGNYIDQGAVVRKYGWPVNYMMLAAAAGVTGYHTWKAQPEEKKKVLTRDALILGATVGGTIFASGGLLAFKQLLKPNMVVNETVEGFKGFLLQGMKPLHAEGESLMKEVADNFKVANKIGDQSVSKELYESVKKHLEVKKDEWLPENHVFSLDDLRKIYNDVKKYEPKKVNEIFNKIFAGEEGLKEEVQEASEFFAIGLLGVLSGIGGGLLANKINGEKDPEKTPDMVKEGIFQFVANIGMCAVGAGSALALMNPKGWAPKALEKPANAVTEFFHHSAGSKLYRFGGVLAGLSVGILGGAHIANYVGRHYVNPVLDKIQGKESKPPEEQEKRHIEGMDMVLHVDDIPTAAAIAGTAILGPWIMPFFPVSGYRAGIGYRNDEKAKQKNKPEAKTPQVNTANSATYLAQSSGLVPQMMNVPQVVFGMPYGQQGGYQNPFNAGQRFQGLKSQGAKAVLN